MKESSHCVYCGQPIFRSENQSNSRSAEHLIPNIATTKKRTNAEADFPVCRKCNSDKSKMDELIGLFSRLSNVDEEAAGKIRKRLDKGHPVYTKTMQSAMQTDKGVQVNIPINGKDVYKYGAYLTKGEYFKNNNKILNGHENIVIVTWLGHGANQQLKEWYGKQHPGRNPFDDLAQNKAIENINNQCFIVSGKDGDEYVFFFNETFAFKTKILRNTTRNYALMRKNKRLLIDGLRDGIRNVYVY